MKIVKLTLVFCSFMMMNSISVFGGGIDYTIAYTPSNPVAGQAVTFRLIGTLTCNVESLVPDAANNVENLIPYPGTDPNTVMYTYPTPGEYHVGLDLDFSNCLRVKSNKTNRDLTPNFQIGPDGGPYYQAIPLDGIFCFPITIAAAPAPIPTMGQWSLIVLALTSSIIGAVYLISSSRLSTKRNL